MSNTIPDDVKSKIDAEAERKYPYAEVTKFNEGYIATTARNKKNQSRSEFAAAAIFGYQLSRQELEAKYKEIERLESEQRITESQLIIAEDGVQRLKGLISQAWAQSKINCEVENGAGDAGEVYISWLQFCKDNNIT